VADEIPPMSGELDRRAGVAALLQQRGDLLVVSGLGGTTWDVAAAGDDSRTFPLWGAMGGAVSLGLGLALARPADRILVITGDGEVLMGLGSLATVGGQQPANLAVAVVDNERYGETGMQPTHTAGGIEGRTDLAAVALACGWQAAWTVRDSDDLPETARRLRAARGPLLAVLKVSADSPPLVMPPRDGAHLKERFRLAVLGEP
jgi:thiamine pyrophosphate-dependent acetolactate synthase large subunit-like protein